MLSFDINLCMSKSLCKQVGFHSNCAMGTTIRSAWIDYTHLYLFLILTVSGLHKMEDDGVNTGLALTGLDTFRFRFHLFWWVIQEKCVKILTLLAVLEKL